MWLALIKEHGPVVGILLAIITLVELLDQPTSQGEQRGVSRRDQKDGRAREAPVGSFIGATDVVW